MASANAASPSALTPPLLLTELWSGEDALVVAVPRDGAAAALAGLGLAPGARVHACGGERWCVVETSVGSVPLERGMAARIAVELIAAECIAIEGARQAL